MLLLSSNPVLHSCLCNVHSRFPEMLTVVYFYFRLFTTMGMVGLASHYTGAVRSIPPVWSEIACTSSSLLPNFKATVSKIHCGILPVARAAYLRCLPHRIQDWIFLNTFFCSCNKEYYYFHISRTNIFIKTDYGACSLHGTYL